MNAYEIIKNALSLAHIPAGEDYSNEHRLLNPAFGYLRMLCRDLNINDITSFYEPQDISKEYAHALSSGIASLLLLHEGDNSGFTIWGAYYRHQKNVLLGQITKINDKLPNL